MVQQARQKRASIRWDDSQLELFPHLHQYYFVMFRRHDKPYVYGRYRHRGSANKAAKTVKHCYGYDTWVESGTYCSVSAPLPKDG
jgi:hypothetical protein